MALRMSGLWCCGLLCFGSRPIGIIVECSVVFLSVCNPSWVASRACRAWSACGVLDSICVCVLKSLMGFFPHVHANDWPSSTIVTLHQVAEELKPAMMS